MKRILVAEDNDSNFLLMSYILKRNYEFFRAYNGREAVEMAFNERPDLVLMDIKMPIMDGIEATRHIKAQLPDMPVIALTANAFDADRQKAFDVGCCDFMAKPINADNCLKTIAKHIGE